ncbi:hypothetical protein OG323_06230 [Streptomyces cyaneofuscatus]|uniref:hypothetical protein n=1 Tax=Streptomyces cyaneofuscatus TaxID=66883 RepID=UPI00386E68FF|nr:hypothetical protein OG323_06230 [Streptomyces cyaneofuscatus]
MPRKIIKSYVPDVYFGTRREEFRVEGTHPWARGHSTREAAEKQAAELDAKAEAEAEGRR